MRLSDDRDYVSPGFAVVRPDAAFPRMTEGDRATHPWPYLRREVPHRWYVDARFPAMGFLNRDEAALLHNIALQFRGKRALEIGSWLGWSTCHLALAGVELDSIDPTHDDPALRPGIDASLAACGVADRVRLHGGSSPGTVHELARDGRKWSLFFIDGDHEPPAPVFDALACRAHAEEDCAFVFHDLASPHVADALRFLRDAGFSTRVYQTAQIMGIAWRGNVRPVEHIPDPSVAWTLPAHLEDLAREPAQPPAVRTKSFPTEPTASPAERSAIRVCIVTNELIGPFKNGGIGTAMTGLAETLADAGFAVTVLFTGAIGAVTSEIEHWRAHYRAKRIELIAPGVESTGKLAGPLQTGLPTPWIVHSELARHEFDVIHFNDCRGDGEIALVAKQLGLAYRNTLLVLATHSPSEWVLSLNHMLPGNSVLVAFAFAEEVSFHCADVVWSPSRYMLEWVRDRGFHLPEQTYVQQYAIPLPPLDDSPSPSARQPLTEVVFFGRLEERKGLRLFCDALDVLRDDLAARNITVTFLGKPHVCGGMPSLEYLKKRGAQWTFPVQTITDHGQPEALAYLRAPGRVAVMASPLDNSPCTVYEALACGIPFLAARTGGIPELVHDDDRAHVLFDHSLDGLSNALRSAIAAGGLTARPAIAQADVRRAWIAMHERWRDLLPDGANFEQHGPETVVALIDAPRGTDPAPTIASLARIPSVRQISVLDRANPDSLRDALATVAYDAVLLVHAGITVDPNVMPSMIAALRVKGLEGLLPALATADGRVIPHLGGSAPFTLCQGVTFNGMLLARSELVLRAANRPLATETPFLGLADFCVVDGRIWPFPEVAGKAPEGWWPRLEGAHPARVAAYAECAPRDRYYMTAAGYGASQQGGVPFGRRRIVARLVEEGAMPLVRAGVWGLRQARRIRSLLRGR